jgi:hypothetical protein
MVRRDRIRTAKLLRDRALPLVLLAFPAFGCGEEEIVEPDPCSRTVQRVELETSGRNPLPRIGDGMRVEVSAFDECDRGLAVSETLWSTSDASVVTASPTTVTSGNTVSEVPDAGVIRSVGFGSAEVRAEVDGVVATLPVEVVRPPTRAQGLEVLGADSVPRRLTDVWVHGDYAYSGTSAGACGGSNPPCSSIPGSLVVWRLNGGGVPTLVDSVALPGPKTNDVKVSPGGDYLVVSQERNEATNGIVVLDLADPARPTVMTHYTDGLDSGVHNLWLENIDGTDYAFVAGHGGDIEDRLQILDLSDPSAPRRVATTQGGSDQVHDVYVRDGLAFVSRWDAGLVILDVGHGIAGGSPTDPVEVSSLVMDGGKTHNAWYWPEAELVFVGEERWPSFSADADTTDTGRLHVVDVSDLVDPREIAFHHIPGETPHNFWLDEEREILYAAWYSRGVRALDVSGTLSGDLSGREIGFAEPSGTRGLGFIWAPQLHRGTLYLSDVYHGLWAVRPLD